MAGRPPTLVRDEETEISPLAGTRAQALQRLQVGVSLLLGIVLIVGLANVIEDRANQSEETAVPEAAATVAPSPMTTAKDPLADAGVVPDMPAQATTSSIAPAPEDLEPADGP